MNKTWIVFKTEIINTVTRRSFLIVLILVPLVPALVLGAVTLFRGEGNESDMIGADQPEEETQIIKEGYIDQEGFITELPDWITEDRLIAFPDTESAREAALSGDISGYYVILDDYLENGTIHYYREDLNPLDGFDSTDIINDVIYYNLLGADQLIYEAYQNPIHVEYIDIQPDEVEVDQSNPLAFYIPYGMTFLIYFLIINSASLMLNSVAKEKENRVIEIIMSSIKPTQLLTGKILGLGLVGMLQMVFWMGSALVMLRLSGNTLSIPAYLMPQPEILLWGIVFFTLGYFLYATIMAGIGALVPNLKEASQATFLVIIPAVIPLMMVSAIVSHPSDTMPVVLSLIPFTASSTIMTRLVVSTVPTWQIIVSIGLLILTIILLIRAVSGMFRAQHLLTGKKFSPSLFLRVLFGKDVESVEESV